MFDHHEAGLSELLHHAMTAESAGDPGVTAENMSAAGAHGSCDACGSPMIFARGVCLECYPDHNHVRRDPTPEELAQAQRDAEAKNAKERARVNLKSFIDRLDRKNGFPPTRWPGEDCK